jgi:murein DD-endopeptidase MepM/ murein hydrolase activator NlpD
MRFEFIKLQNMDYIVIIENRKRTKRWVKRVHIGNAFVMVLAFLGVFFSIFFIKEIANVGDMLAVSYSNNEKTIAKESEDFSSERHYVANHERVKNDVAVLGSEVNNNGSDEGGFSVDVEDDEEKHRIIESTGNYTPPKEQPLEIFTHVVKKGETIWGISRLYGVSMDTIFGSNELTSYDLIRPGMVLKIPNKDGILYEVKKGDTIDKIAKRYKVDKEKIIRENGVKKLYVGQLIFIPDATPLNKLPGFIWPVRGRITSPYGYRRNPMNPRRIEFHEGIDIGVHYRYIRASRYGKVVYAGWLGGYGKTIIIAHLGGYKTLYAHLSSIFVKVGQYVKQGQIIGRSGNTGFSTGPHLHFEIIKRGRSINPLSLLRR